MNKDLLLAPLVVAQRVPLLWLEMFGMAGSSRESERMVHEKFAAAAEGTVALQIEMQRIWWQSSLAMVQGVRPPTLMQTGTRLANAALQPAAKRIRSNVKRLSGTKRG